MSLRVDFGLRVKELRSRSGISQEELAFRSGLDRSYIGGVERGERNISIDNIGKIAVAFNVTLTYLFSNERFSTNPAYLKKDLKIPFSERFKHHVDQENKIVSWQINGVLTEQEVDRMTSTLVMESTRLGGKVDFLVDHRDMLVDNEAIGYSPGIAEKAELLQKSLRPFGNKFVVLCNSQFMVDQFNVITQRSGIYDAASHLYCENRGKLLDEAYHSLAIHGNELVTRM